MRRHPIYKRYLMHNGIDLGGQRGVDIYATGNGYIDVSTGVKSGYGKQVLINHGFGYQTRYAHLSKITVVSGQYVKRGEKIGELGNTGRSTGPHLHYEVIYMGKHLDPINFLRRDMTDEELQKIVNEARATTYEL
jgi:murein DD-endopeptidase MepM/ murein hydrolase activator NlpD